MTTQHQDITDPYIHEPKGIDGVVAGKVYVSDGAGSGIWTNFPEQIVTGFYDYNDLTTATTPIAVPGTLAFVYITNDGAGPNTNLLYTPDGFTDIWSVGLNKFDWAAAGCQLGDTIEIRLDCFVTTTIANQYVEMDLEMSTDGTPYDVLFAESTFKTAGTYQINRFNGVYMGNASTLDNRARFKVRSDGAATLQVNGWYVKVTAKR